MTNPETLPDTGLDTLLNTHFAGKVVRKDLTKLIKEGANVPVYVLEYLLGMYCASNDEAVIQNGLVNVKRILTENYVRPDEAEKVKSKVRESGTYKVIDKITERLINQKKTAGMRPRQTPDGIRRKDPSGRVVGTAENHQRGWFQCLLKRRWIQRKRVIG